MTKIKFENTYSKIGKHEEGRKIKFNAEDMTDQSQIVSASIVEMAKRFGIDAIIAKAEQRNIEMDSYAAQQLYGNDFTQMFKSREDMLNTRKKVQNIFENIPARIRKEYFNDNPMEFINAYTTNDEKKLTSLKNIGLISETQLNSVKEYNKRKINEQKENELRQKFIKKLEEKQGALYENFKKNGDINININQDNTTNNANIQSDI